MSTSQSRKLLSQCVRSGFHSDLHTNIFRSVMELSQFVAVVTVSKRSAFMNHFLVASK